MSKRIVATGHINVLGGPASQASRIISDQEISDRAFRRCPRGSAHCGFAGVEVTMPDARGDVTVTTLCNPTTSRDPNGCCQASDTSLQTGLDRLRATKPPVTTSKQK